MKHEIIALALFMAVFASMASAAPVNLAANVGNGAPTVGTIEICDGTCGIGKAIDPATAFKVQVTITDPNGQGDINSMDLEFFKASDSQGNPANWDHVTLAAVAHSSGSGCTESGSTYCLTVGSGDWTTKFLKGEISVYVKAYDTALDSDANTGVEIATVNASVGRTEDTTSGTFSGSADSNNNAFTSGQTAAAFIVSTHNGNTDMNVSVTASNLTKGGDSMGSSQMKWYLSNNSGSAIAFTGSADAVNTNFARGTDPTSASMNFYTWLDIPALQPSGNYTGTFTYNSVEA